MSEAEDQHKVDWEALQAPIEAQYLKTVDKGYGDRTYVDAPALMQRLDDVLTPSGWQEETEIVWHGDYPVATCSLQILCEDDRWTRKDGIGGPNNVKRVDGVLIVTDEEPAKSAASDAFRRACRKWGIGRELWLDASTSTKATQASSKERSESEDGEDRGNCSVHDVPYRHNVGESAKGKPYDFWSCPEKNEDGSWCNEKPPKLPDPEEQSVLDSEPPDGDDEAQARTALLISLRKQYPGAKLLIAVNAYCKANELPPVLSVAALDSADVDLLDAVMNSP